MTEFAHQDPLWTILHQTPVPNGATWSDLIAEHTPEDLLAALKGSKRNRRARLRFVECTLAYRSTFGTKYPEAPAHQKVVRRWEITLLQETHWEASDLAVWENLFPAATIVASEADNGAGGVAIIIPPSVEITHRRVIVPGYAVMADLRFREQPIRVLVMVPPARAQKRGHDPHLSSDAKPRPSPFRRRRPQLQRTCTDSGGT